MASWFQDCQAGEPLFRVLCCLELILELRVFPVCRDPVDLNPCGNDAY